MMEHTQVQFGRHLLQYFSLDPSWRNLNHSSYGTFPRAIRTKLREYQDRLELRPDPFIRYEYPKLLIESRQAVANLLRVPVRTVVFVPNATNAINTVLRNIQWNSDQRDEIIYFDTIYGACGKTIHYITESNYGLVASRAIRLEYPCEDDQVLAAFETAVSNSKSDGRRPRICVFDTVSSLPGIRFPFEMMARKCKELGVTSVVDGAQGIGMVDLDLPTLDPDFFFSNCHKWLHVPRGCAVLYVPARNQHLMVSTLPTSHGYIPGSLENSDLPGSLSTEESFVRNFEGMGTIDNSPYLCVKDSIAWRDEVLGGEERIIDYGITLAKTGGRLVARILGTEVMDNSTQTGTNCAMVNVKLPLDVVGNSLAATNDMLEWMMRTLVDEYQTFIVVFSHNQGLWVRLSAQVYLDTEDFRWAGWTLHELCQKAKREFRLDGSMEKRQ